jgi:hypothetical protein
MNNGTQQKLRALRKMLSDLAKLQYGFMSFFFSTVLKADSLLLYLVLGTEAGETIKNLVSSRSFPLRQAAPTFGVRA